jgi:hypothetical protein
MRKPLALAAAILTCLVALTVWSGAAKLSDDPGNNAEFPKLYEQGKTLYEQDKIARVPITRSASTATEQPAGTSHATPGTATGNVPVTTAIGCALTVTLSPDGALPPGGTLPRTTTVPCVQHG